MPVTNKVWETASGAKIQYKYLSQRCKSAGIYLFQVKHGNIRIMCEVYSKSTMETSEKIVKRVQS